MKIMAIDYGDAHTGVAVSDRTLTLCGFSTVVTAYRPEAVIEQLQRLMDGGCGHLGFIIGGSLGLSKTVLDRSDAQVSFSEMTFPHQLMRVILAEQIYRGFRIMKGEPYHK